MFIHFLAFFFIGFVSLRLKSISSSSFLVGLNTASGDLKLKFIFPGIGLLFNDGC